MPIMQWFLTTNAVPLFEKKYVVYELKRKFKKQFNSQIL